MRPLSYLDAWLPQSLQTMMEMRFIYAPPFLASTVSISESMILNPGA